MVYIVLKKEKPNRILSFFEDEKLLTKLRNEYKMTWWRWYKIKNKTIQDWIKIETINERGIIKLKNKKIVKLIKINPINYNLKSDLEKKSILNSYKIFLKTCNFDIQILIQSNKKDLNNHFKNIEKINSKNKKNEINIIEREYFNYIKNINLSKKSSAKDFYIIIAEDSTESKEIKNVEIIENELKEKFFKIKECLLRCGNNVQEITTKEECKKILCSFYNTRKNLQNIE